MAAVTEKLTRGEFERQYADRKPYREFWFGEAVAKAMPTWIHGILQGILVQLFKELGYRSGSEVKLKIGADFEPIPDVIATSGEIELPYPTAPVDVVVEILSPEDSFQRVLRKCRLYAEWGVSDVIVLDPEGREGWLWDQQAARLNRVTTLALRDGKSLPFQRIFDELDAMLR